MPLRDRQSLMEPGVALPLQHRVQPSLLGGMVHRKRDTFFGATPQPKGDRIRVTDFMQRPILVVSLQRQAPKLLHFRAGIGIADRLIDPRRANLDMGKRLCWSACAGRSLA